MSTEPKRKGALGHLESLEIAERVARMAEEKKAEDIVVLDMSELLFVTDYFVICSGNNDRHVKSIADSIRSEMRDQGVRPLWADGLDQGFWVVLDFGGVVVHVFRNEEREIYQIERLWKDAPRHTVAPEPA